MLVSLTALERLYKLHKKQELVRKKVVRKKVVVSDNPFLAAKYLQSLSDILR